MSAAFYDHPVTGKLHLRAPAGGGGSEYDGLATETDIRNHPEAHQRYHHEKRIAADHAAREAEHVKALVAVDEAIAALKDEAHHASAVDGVDVWPDSA